MTPVIPAKLPDPPLPRAAPHAGPGTVAAQPRHAAPGRDGAGIWLNAAAVGLLALSGAAAAVSFSARLLQYTAARGGDLAPISPDFAAICDQFDRADAMLYDLRHRTSQGERSPGPAWPDIDGQPIIALARREAGTKTVTFVLDGATANAAIYAIVAHATEREARIREVQRKALTFPKNPTAAPTGAP
jgi:hypothetical protein